MIENLRKYTGLIIFVIALLLVGFIFTIDNGSGMGGGNANDPVVISIDGRSYRSSEFEKLGPSSRSLAMQLGLYDMVSTLGGFGGANEREADERFFANRINLREAREEFGVHPDDEAVAAMLKSMPAFQGPDGAYSQTNYNNIVNRALGRMGLRESDMLDLVRDTLALRTLGRVVGGGLAVNRRFAEESVLANDQKVTVEVARLDIGKYEEALDPTEEELKESWETTKDKYLTDKRIKVSWILASPGVPETKVEEETLPEDATEEQKKAAADKKSAAETALAEEKRRLNNELAERVDLFLDELRDSEGKDFEKLAGENGWEVKTSEMFPRSAVPQELGINLRASSDQRSVADFLFALTKSTDPLDAFTEALPVGEGQWFVARLDEAEEPRPKEFEEAKDEVRADFIAEKASGNLKKDAEEKTAKIREALAEGKSFSEAAKDQGLEVVPHGPFAAGESLENEADSQTLFQTAARVAPGTLADPLIRPDSARLVFVGKREIVKDDGRAARIDGAVTAGASTQQRLAFAAWLDERLAASRIEYPARR